MSDGPVRRQHRMLNIVDEIKPKKKYRFHELVDICQKTTFMIRPTCERLIRDMVTVGYLKRDGEHFYV